MSISAYCRKAVESSVRAKNHNIARLDWASLSELSRVLGDLRIRHVGAGISYATSYDYPFHKTLISNLLFFIHEPDVTPSSPFIVGRTIGIQQAVPVVRVCLRTNSEKAALK